MGLQRVATCGGDQREGINDQFSQKYTLALNFGVQLQPTVLAFVAVQMVAFVLWGNGLANCLEPKMVFRSKIRNSRYLATFFGAFRSEFRFLDRLEIWNIFQV